MAYVDIAKGEDVIYDPCENTNDVMVKQGPLVPIVTIQIVSCET